MSNGVLSVVISGSGYCLGERLIDNHKLETFINTSDAFIRERTGLIERRYVSKDKSNADLGVAAAEMALKSANIDISEVDLLIVNTLSPDHHDPSQACFIMPKLGAKNIPAFDIRAQCSGALYAMDIGRQYLDTGRAKNILVICSEILSRRMDPSDAGRNLAVLLSDGAGAYVLSASAKHMASGIKDLVLDADGEFYDLLKTHSPGTASETFISKEEILAGLHQFRMDGAGLFAHAVKSMSQIVKIILKRNKLTISDIDLVIPHQPNLRLLETVFDCLKIPQEKTFITVSTLGNMASASWPIAYAMAVEQGRIKENSLVLFLTYGSGATWGAGLYQS